jgi:S-adenosylmethionine decarboxylase
MTYEPGLHILAEISCSEENLLRDYASLRDLYDSKIKQYGLSKLGEVYHSFENAGYTGVVCLTESHIAVHTWPEFGLLTFDVYLSNFTRNNDEVTRSLFRDTLSFFKSTSYSVKEIRR